MTSQWSPVTIRYTKRTPPNTIAGIGEVFFKLSLIIFFFFLEIYEKEDFVYISDAIMVTWSANFRRACAKS